MLNLAFAFASSILEFQSRFGVQTCKRLKLRPRLGRSSDLLRRTVDLPWLSASCSVRVCHVDPRFSLLPSTIQPALVTVLL